MLTSSLGNTGVKHGPSHSEAYKLVNCSNTQMVEECTVLCIQCPLSKSLCPSYLNKKEQSRRVLELEPFTELRQALEE